jgi:HSP20 family molecular chaperone IbpA
MSTLFRENYFSPFDLLVKDFFKSELDFQPANQAKYSHPVDIYENPEGLHFEIACTGLTKKDIEIQIEGDIFNIRYNKDNDEKCCEVNNCNYIHKGIARRSFSLGYKVANKFNLTLALAEMENGLLKISIPFSEESKPKILTIK